MGAWFCAVPVWGDWYAERFVNDALPSHRAALDRLPWPVRYIVHTDRPKLLAEAMAGMDVEFRPVPEARDAHASFQEAHRDAVLSAPAGARLVLLSADLVLSVEAFAAPARRFAEGFEAVVCAGTRTLPREPVPAGAAAAALLDWSMRNPHPITADCFWPEGRSAVPWAIYFRHQGDITLRAWHLHPLAIIRPAALSWSGSIDRDLLDGFERSRIHVVTARDELALAEISPPDRGFGRIAEPQSPKTLAAWATRNASPLHRWLAGHRILIAGEGRTPDTAIWPLVEARLGPFDPTPPPRRRRRR